MTTIYCTAKLEAFLKPYITESPDHKEGTQWNAHLFFLEGRKCLAFIHKETGYSVVILNVIKSHLKNIHYLFRKHCLIQMSTDGILEESQAQKVIDFIGEVEFRKTNNDKSNLAFLRVKLEELCYHSSLDYALFYLEKGLNTHFNGDYKRGFNKELMKKLIDNLF